MEMGFTLPLHVLSLLIGNILDVFNVIVMQYFYLCQMYVE